MKKLLLKYLALMSFLISSLPLSAVEIDGIEYSLNSSDNTATVTSKLTKYSGDIVIPSTIEISRSSYTVTSIGSHAFSYCSSLTSVEIPNSVISIDWSAFSGCSGLTSVEIPNSVTSIGSCAFSNCSSITFINIPDNVTSIEVSVFEGCSNMKSVEIGKSVTSIGSSAFKGCSNLTSIQIPDEVITIDKCAFMDCSSLNSVEIGKSVISIGALAFEGCNSMASIEIPNSVTSIGASVFSECKNLKSIKIGMSVISIEESAFYGCSSLNSVEIPNSVTKIGPDAFYGCSSLNSVEIPNSVTTIGPDAFYGCSQLTFITIGNSVTSIGSGAFRECSALNSVEIPTSVISIGESAFEGCTNLKDFSIADGDSVLEFGNRVFINAPIENLYVGKNFYCSSQHWSVIPFYGKTSLKTVTIGNFVTNIESNSFEECDCLNSVSVGNSVTFIGSYAFRSCNNIEKVEFASIEDIFKIQYEDLTSNPIYYASHLWIAGEEIKDMKIPSSVTMIDRVVFPGCGGLISLTIPNSVESINDNTFSNCKDLKEVIIEDGKSTLKFGYNVFENAPIETLYLGRRFTSPLLNTDHIPFGGKKSLMSLTIGNSVTSVGIRAFENCSSLKEVFITDGESTISILTDAFLGTPIEKLYLGRSFRAQYSSNYNEPFGGKESITTLIIGNHVSFIGESAFSKCKGLTSIKIGNSLSSIGSSAFSGCEGLSSIIIGNSVTSIGSSAFSGCGNLKEVTLSDGDLNLEFDKGVFTDAPIENLYLGRHFTCKSSKYFDHPFRGKFSLKTLIIGNGITSIEPEAFIGYSGLTSVEIGNSVTSIGDNAFFGCNELRDLILGLSITEISTKAFDGCDIARITSSAIIAPKIEVSSFSSLTKLSCNVNVPEESLSSYQNNWCVFRCFVKDFDAAEIITVSSPGNLINQIPIDKVNEITRLKLIGDLNGTDILTLNKCSSIILLDLSETTIVSGGMPYYEKDNVRFGTKDNMLGEMWSYNLSQLSWLKLPESLVKIGEKSFYDKNSLIEIRIPSSVSSIDSHAFDGCSGLNVVSIADGETIIEFGLGVFCEASIETLNLGRSFICKSSHVADFPFYMKSSLKNLIIGDSVTSISNSAFSGCIGLTSVTIPNSVLSIDNSAFYACNSLTSVEIGNTVTVIGDYAFSGCSNLDSVVFPTSITTIGAKAFNGCSNLTSIEIPNSVTTIGESAFRGCCGLTSVMLPNYISSINSSVFQDCNSLISIEIPNSVESIGFAAFMDCNKLASIELPNSVASIGSSAFSGCSGLTSVKLSTALTEIANSTFYGCENLSSVNIPDPVQKIGAGAFSGCSALASVTLPGSLREVSATAFEGCNNLKSVSVINPIPPVIESNTFPMAAEATVTVPNGSKNIYWIHPYWGKFSTINTWGGNDSEGTVFASDNISYRVTSDVDGTVEVSAASLIGRASDIEIPTEVEFNGKTYRVAGIANNGFENVAVSSISLPATIGYVGLEAFKGCNGLRTLTCLAQTPPSVYANSFDESTYSEAALEVPEDLISVYEKDAVWGKFNVRTISVPVSGIEINDPETSYLVGNEFTITASVYPENASTDNIIWTSSDETIATVDENGEVTVVGVGKVTITASCGEISSSCSIKCYPQTGDANWSGNISIADAVDISNYVVKKKSAPEGWDKAEWTEFYTAGANANESEDGEITFADAFAAVRLALAQPSAMPTQNRIGADDKDGNDTSDALVVERVTMTEDGKTAIAVKLDNSRDYVALQSDIFFPEGMNIEVKIGNRAASHSLETMKHDENHIRLALFDLGNKTFADGDEPIFEIIADADLKDIENMILSNILAADAEANEFALDYRMNDITGVDTVASQDICIKKGVTGINVYNAAGKMINICTMEGQTIKSFVAKDNHETINLPAGTYIVKAGDKTLKVIL